MELQEKNSIVLTSENGDIIRFCLEKHSETPERFKAYVTLNDQIFELRKFPSRRLALDFWQYLNLIIKKKDV